MVDNHEWEWIVERTTEGGVDHLLLGMSDPFLLAPGLHDVQAWSEAVANGRWGHRAARMAESLRESLDLDHWASFEESFGQLARLLEDVGSRRNGRPPASILAMSGDVHNAYLAEVAFPRSSGVESRVYQAVCSPLRNALKPKERRAQELAASPIGTAIGRLLAVSAGVARPPIRWQILDGPSFENQIATLEIDGRTSDLTIERAAAGDGGPPTLEPIVRRRLA
jgi:hypothetical protein